ncbi:threonine-phosphate decarboxylase CobD [Roseomonas elaeocarpi]|uniref:threonine-phosphate decarboxylase n=1 Tax=Roseomonas elaeocarpi TaxID=907779 RepID=A0ABV6JXS9_9PROT
MPAGARGEAPAPPTGATLREHGGSLAAARARFPEAPEPWIDLSTGINPWPYPVPPLPPESWARLPEPTAQARLEAAAARAFGLRDPAAVVAAPGTQLLIGLLPRLIPAAAVGVLTPTYNEHAASWAAAGARVVPCAEPAALARHPVGVLCNPNNPDGRRHDPAALLGLAARMPLLVVDEAFADMEDAPGLSLAPSLPREGLVVLRSFGKAYGLAGLRLGFALAPPRLAARLREALGPWCVSGPALAIGTAALGDEDWRRDAARRCAAAATRLDRLLETSGLEIVGGTSLFRLARHPEAVAIHDRLGRAGIHIRRFAAMPDRLRFGLPPDEPAWSRLAAALTAPG